MSIDVWCRDVEGRKKEGDFEYTGQEKRHKKEMKEKREREEPKIANHKTDLDENHKKYSLFPARALATFR